MQRWRHLWLYGGQRKILLKQRFGLWAIVAETAEDAKFKPVSINLRAWELKDECLLDFNTSNEWGDIDFISAVSAEGH
ncbi:MAG: hypothetical protein ACTS7D_00720 [Candidatus Hodgkinia cicadicola]